MVNVSKSQYYEFRHNIMNLGKQNSKYSWRIRDLENPQTGTQFANSVLMYKMLSIDVIHFPCNFFIIQVLLPCNIDFNLSAPKGEGQHIAVSISEIMLNISPETIKILSAASQSLTPPQVSCNMIFTCMYPTKVTFCGAVSEEFTFNISLDTIKGASISYCC